MRFDKGARRRDDSVLAIGPANYAGQAYEWAEALKRNLRIAAFSFANQQPIHKRLLGKNFGFAVHQFLPHHRMTSTAGKVRRMRCLLEEVSHLAVDGFLPVFGRQDETHVGADVEQILAWGLQLALIAHGSDVRDPVLHIQRYTESYYASAPDEWVATMIQSSRRNRETAQSFGGRVYVSTPDLLIDIPTAVWLPVCVNVDRWRASRPALEQSVPTVLHVPSRRSPAIKGTAYIDPALRNLADNGRIRYLAPEMVRHQEIRSLVAESDIVVDQIQSGSYGVAAVEAMAAGRLVVGYMGEDVVRRMPARPPIVNASPARFIEVFDEILDDPSEYYEQAAAGVNYARKWHDGRVSSRVLGDFMAAVTR